MTDFSNHPAAAALSTVHGYRMLTSGWDGSDSLAPRPEHLNLATDLFRAWPGDLPAPIAMLSSDGTVGMYWSLDHLYMDAEYDEDGRMSVFARRKHDGHEHFQNHLDVNEGRDRLLHILRHGI